MEQQYTISTFYKFTPLAECEAMRVPIKRAMIQRNVKGTITLAPEGINATISGPEKGVFEVINKLQADPRIGSFEHKESFLDRHPFQRSKVKVKSRLITCGVDVDPTVCVGTYVESKDWNAIISAPDVITIDTRNDYEYRIGRFKGAINPNTDDFREMQAYTEQHLNPAKHKRVAMYCTGGIRCEKYSSYLLQVGFEEVYHLKGGILQYLADVPESETMWEGKCFVFDERVAVNHDLSEAEDIIMCLGCGNPLTDKELQDKWYVENIRCRYCDE
ncbi:MAG: rhodanese-related sulfurtransferase [Rickettsiales bacterium]|nr:rhodanese-related sulfurtransferase [Rickettsiales bacterium]